MTSVSNNHPAWPTKVPWAAVSLFVLLSWGLAWLVALPLWTSGEGLDHPLALLILPAIMFTPLAATLIVVFAVQKPRPRPTAEYLGLWPLRPAKRTVGMTVAAIFGCALLVIAGTFLASALGFITLDLQEFSGFAQTLRDQGLTSLPAPIEVLVLVQLLSIPIGAVINAFVSFGEELGWRGWLLPSLMPLGTWPALIATGVIWGLWHSPVILLGYNFNQPNLLGIGLMIGGCTMLGILLGWLRLRTASIWPAVFGHGAFNAAAGFPALVVAAGTSASATAASPLGWVPWIVMAAATLVVIGTGQFKRQPELQHRSGSRTSFTPAPERCEPDHR